jgi:hypothetical protein
MGYRFFQDNQEEKTIEQKESGWIQNGTKKLSISRHVSSQKGKES